MSIIIGQFYSWEILSHDVIIKNCDKSVFQFRSSGIPIPTRRFWRIESMHHPDKIGITLNFQQVAYKAIIKTDKRGGTNLLWHRDLDKVINSERGSLRSESLQMRFKRVGENIYDLSLLENIQSVGTNSTDLDRRYFWVNHNQTASTERGNKGKGSKYGFIWAPKCNRDKSINQTYINLTEVRKGDIIVSYANGEIGFIGIANSKAHSFNKPKEFEKTGENWNIHGWKVGVNFEYKVKKPINPRKHIDRIKNLLPIKNSPIQHNGNGNQRCYLARISSDLGVELLKLCSAYDLLENIEHRIVENEINQINQEKGITNTQKKQLIDARIGQGKFRKNVLKLYPRCPVTGIGLECILRASHIKPWRVCNNQERLDPYNGIMLAAHIDALFDRGYISFDADGSLLVTPEVRDEFKHLGIEEKRKIFICKKNTPYLEWHRKNVFISD